MKIAKGITILIFICSLGIWFYGKQEMKKQDTVPPVITSAISELHVDAAAGEAGLKEGLTASDDMDGEPDSPLKRPYEIVNPITEREKREKQYKFQYMMLSRLQSDCVGFFGRDDDESSHMDCRYHNEHFIWGKDIRKLVSEMKRLWDEIPEDLKPEWLTREEVEGFCKRVS